MARKPWTRDETLAAFNLYCRTPFGRLHARNPDIIGLAEALGRTPGAVAMKCCNLASYDPALQARGIKGLSKASRLDAEVWSQFQADPESVGYESELAFARLERISPRTSDSVEWEDIQGLDRTVLTKVRVNQHLFRSIILAGYRSECAVCKLPISALLVASHIVPWSADKSLRMNPRNGICLCAIHDRAFDVGILQINASYCVSIDSGLGRAAKSPAVGRFLLAYSGRRIALPDRWHPAPELLEQHARLVAHQT